MRHPLPPMNALRGFEASARHLSMSDAAGELGVSQSAVSQQVRTLEEWLGTDLFDRQPGRIALTEAGQDLAQAAIGALNQVAEAAHTITERGTVPHIALRVEPAFGGKWMRRRLNALKAHLGRVEMEMWTNHSVPAKFPEQTDILIHYGARPNWPGVETVDLVDVHGFPACSPDLLAQLGPLEVPEDIARYHLLHGVDRHTWRSWIGENNVLTVSAMGGTLYDDFGLTIEAAVEGEGALIADPLMCEKELARGDLVPLSDVRVFCASYFLSGKETKFQRSVVRKARAWIVEEVAKVAGP